MNLFKGAIALVATTTAMILFGAGAAHASIVDVGPVQVGTTSSDQPSDLIAVSNGGNATGTAGCVVASACVGNNETNDYPGLVAVSTTGSATGGYVAGATILGDGCADSWALTISVAGNACGGVVAVSGFGDASGGPGVLAVSGTGVASSGLVAVSGTNSANAPVASPPSPAGPGWNCSVGGAQGFLTALIFSPSTARAAAAAIIGCIAGIAFGAFPS